MTGTRVTKFISLKFPSDMGGILRPQIHLRRTMSIGSLNNDSLRLYMELCEFFLLGGIVTVIVAGVDADFDLCIKTGVDFRGWIDTVWW